MWQTNKGALVYQQNHTNKTLHVRHPALLVYKISVSVTDASGMPEVHI